MSNFTNFLADLATKIIQSDGTEVPRRQTVNFTGGTVTDDPTNDRTNVSLGDAAGQNNTNSNAGTGAGELVKTKVGVDTPIKTIAKATDDLITVANGTNEVTLSIPNVQRGTGDPDGVVSSTQGDLFIRTDTAAVYQNTDGSTSWSELGGDDENAIHDNVDAEISAVALKGAPVGADLILIEDSEASNAKKRVTATSIAALASGSDTDAIHDNVAGEIDAITAKTAPVAADVFLMEDSEDSDAKKKIAHSNLFLGLNTVTFDETAISPSSGAASWDLATKQMATMTITEATNLTLTAPGSSHSAVFTLVVTGSFALTLTAGSGISSIWPSADNPWTVDTKAVFSIAVVGGVAHVVMKTQ